MEITVEFTIEPFADGAPGPHVRAAIEVAEMAGLAVDIGPFGTSVSGPADEVLTVVSDLTRAAVEHGATRVSLQLTMG